MKIVRSFVNFELCGSVSVDLDAKRDAETIFIILEKFLPAQTIDELTLLLEEWASSPLSTIDEFLRNKK